MTCSLQLSSGVSRGVVWCDFPYGVQTLGSLEENLGRVGQFQLSSSVAHWCWGFQSCRMGVLSLEAFLLKTDSQFPIYLKRLLDMCLWNLFPPFHVTWDIAAGMMFFLPKWKVSLLWALGKTWSLEARQAGFSFLFFFKIILRGSLV